MGGRSTERSAIVTSRRSPSSTRCTAGLSPLRRSQRGCRSLSALPRLILLAASGRLEEARAALEGYSPGDASDVGPDIQHQRFVFSADPVAGLGRRPCAPAGRPPAPAFDLESMPSVGEIWRHSRERDAAVKATRRFVGDLDRDELRACLAEELASRGASMSPLQVEQALDRLVASPAELREQTFEGLGMLAKLAVTTLTAVRDRAIPDLTPPDWVNPPTRAAYRFPRDQHDRWTRVEPSSSTARPRAGSTASTPACPGRSGRP